MRVATRFNTGDQSWDWGHKQFRGANTPYGALITYWLGTKPAADSLVKVEILKNGTVIRTLKRPSAAQGFNRVTWDLRMDPPKFLTDMNPDSAEAGDWRSRPVGPQVLPGQYVGPPDGRRPVAGAAAHGSHRSHVAGHDRGARRRSSTSRRACSTSSPP